MKITFVLTVPGMSGGMRVVAIYAEALAARGHEVLLLSQPVARLSWKARARRFLKGWGGGHMTGSHLDHLGVTHRQLESQRPVTDADVPDADVVIATWWETGEWVWKLSPSKGAKVYFIQHHEVFPWLPVERSRAVYRLPMRKVVVAAWLERVMAEEYGDRDVDLVPNSVDHAQFHAPARGRQSRPTIGFLYSPAEFKGIDITLAAIARLRARFPDLRVVSFGLRVPDPVAFEQIEFQLSPPQEALRDVYASCDVWVTASRSEGFNLPAMEAMACRTPVVSTKAGWPEEAIVDHVNGMLVEVDDVDALTAAAQWVLERPDPEWRRLSQAAFATVRDSSWKRSADLFEAALQREAARRQ